MVRPVPLALEAGQDGVVAERLLAEAQLSQARVANHKVADNDRALYNEFPFPILAPPGVRASIVILALGTVFPDPAVGPLEFFLVQNLLLDPANQFGHVDALHTHPEEVFEEILVNNRAGDT